MVIPFSKRIIITFTANYCAIIPYKKSYTVKEATRKIEHFCAYQERCHLEVKNKLRDMHMIPEAIDQIIGHLINHNFLNEQRFAETYARGKFRIKKWGKVRIVKELKARQISVYNIKYALKEIPEDDYLTTFDQLVKKRLEELGTIPLTEKRKKLASYLLYRGWESHLVYEKTRNL